MRFFNIVLGTDAFDGMDDLTASQREELMTRLAERGMLDMREGIFDIVDITDKVAALTEA